MPSTIVAQFGAETAPTTEPGPLEQFVEANALAIGTVVAIAAVALGVILLYAAMHRNRRVHAMAPTAERHGLNYTAGDLLGCTKINFPLFRAGDGRLVENVMWRTGANGLDVRVFDYAYYEEIKDANGKSYKRWQYANCAMARHNGLWPEVHISRRRVLDAVADKLALPDITLESEAFNRTFRVQCADARFATALLDPDMMELLLHTEGHLTFETKGRWLLVIAPRLDTPAEMVGLLGVADEFLKRIPPVVWELYGEGADTEDGQALPESLPEALMAQPMESVARVLREDRQEDQDWRDPTPGVHYDLDGNVIEPPAENPW